MVKINIKDKVDGKEIDLSLSELSEVPIKELAQLPKVTHVDLSCNHLQTLSTSFCSLTHIVRLDLSKNHLIELPQNFGSLRQLQTLDLYENKLTDLPVSFSQLRNLRWLDLKNNPLSQKLKSVAGDCLKDEECFKCAKQIIQYLKIVESELEREKQKKLQQEREKEAAQKAQEEQEMKLQKQQKKADKLRKKAERQEGKLKLAQETIKNEKVYKSEENDTKRNGFVPLPKKHSRCGLVLKWLILLVVILPLMAVCVSVTYHLYSGKHISSLAQLKEVTIESWVTLKNGAFQTWEVFVKEEKRFFQILISKWKLWWGVEQFKHQDF